MRGSFSCDGRVLTHPHENRSATDARLIPEELATYIEDLPGIARGDAAVEVRRRAVHERFGG